MLVIICLPDLKKLTKLVKTYVVIDSWFFPYFRWELTSILLQSWIIATWRANYSNKSSPHWAWAFINRSGNSSASMFGMTYCIDWPTWIPVSFVWVPDKLTVWTLEFGNLSINFELLADASFFQCFKHFLNLQAL